ncbi:MAG TPA: DUF2157 domain-containing protein [Burkholderiaceae bacterium]|nr:DUF2157 domain-containing protein [Burkholderiaceae bacterium]
MNTRLALYELAHQHRLDATATERLFAAAGLAAEPAGVVRWFWRAMAVLAAALGGLGTILWLAANWDTLGRLGRFTLLQGFVLVMCLGAWWRPAARAPLGLLALLGIGGLFAYFGQTYQTGADPWQLFALWAVLALPLCLGARSDVLWAPWALVVVAAISLWTHAFVGHRWRVQPDDLLAHAIAWTALAVLVAALSRPLARFTGAGIWAMRSAVTLGAIMVSIAAIGGLFHSTVAPHYVLGLVLFGLAAAVLALPRFFEVYALSAVLLSLNTLLVAGLARWLLDGLRGDPIGAMLMLGLFAAGLLAASVNLILRLVRRYGTEPATQGAAA